MANSDKDPAHQLILHYQGQVKVLAQTLDSVTGCLQSVLNLIATYEEARKLANPDQEGSADQILIDGQGLIHHVSEILEIVGQTQKP